MKSGRLSSLRTLRPKRPWLCEHRCSAVPLAARKYRGMASVSKGSLWLRTRDIHHALSCSGALTLGLSNMILGGDTSPACDPLLRLQANKIKGCLEITTEKMLQLGPTALYRQRSLHLDTLDCKDPTACMYVSAPCSQLQSTYIHEIWVNM